MNPKAAAQWKRKIDLLIEGIERMPENRVAENEHRLAILRDAIQARLTGES